MLNSKYCLILAGHVNDMTTSGHAIFARKSMLGSLLAIREIITRNMRLPWTPAGTAAAVCHTLIPTECAHFETG